MITRLLSTSWARGCALILGLLSGLATGPAAQAQTWNYLPAQAANTVRFYSTLTSGTVIATSNTDDANSAPQNIGFPFYYNGTTFTQFVLNTNGIMRLGSSAPSAANLYPTFEVQRAGVDPITSTDPADVNLLAPFNFDLQASAATNAVPPEYRVAILGTAPTRLCIVQWKNVTDRPGATNLSQFGSFEFQVRLYETFNVIEFAYSFASYTNNPPASRGAVVGIKGLNSNEDVLASKFLSNAPWSNASFFQGTYSGTNFNFRSGYGPDQGRAFRFTPRLPCAAATVTVSSFTPTTAQLTIAPAAGGASYTVVAKDPSGTTVFTQTVTTPTVSLTGLTPGTAYLVSIVTNCTGGGNSLPAVVGFTTPTGTPTNDECADAIQLTPGDCTTHTAGTTLGATQSLPAIRCAGITGNANDDVWYKFIATATTHSVKVIPNGSMDAVIDVRAGACPGANIGCADAAGPGTFETAALTGLTVGATYYVRVYASRLVDDGPFFICVSGTAAPCPAVAGLSVGSATATGATLTFTPVAGATNYSVSVAPVAGGQPSLSTAPGSPVALSGLQAGTAYAVSVTTICPGGQSLAAATTTFTTLLGTATRAALAGGTLVVFPNPAHRAFTLRLPALGATRTARLTLVNALGQTVHSQVVTLAITGTQTQITVAGLAAGLYTVRVQAGIEEATTRLTVE